MSDDYIMVHGTRVRFAARKEHRCREAPVINSQQLWAELHRRGLAAPPGQDDGAWLIEFRMQLPCGGCRLHWDAFCASMPPDWGNYFAWTVAAHNEVNRRLGKPELTVEEAKCIWG